MASDQERIRVDFDPEALKRKYAEERDKRMRSDGICREVFRPLEWLH